LPRKTLLRIGEVARLVGVSASSIRNWERLGLIAVRRSPGGFRLYSAEAVRQLRRIHYLRRVKGVNPSGILQIRGSDVAQPFSATSRAAIGERLAGRRGELGLSYKETAARTGLSTSFVAAVEHGTAACSVSSLQKLARAYETNVLSLYDGQGQDRRLVRPRDRGILTSGGVRMELLAFGALQMEPHLFRVPPRATSGGTYRHEGEEFIFMPGRRGSGLALDQFAADVLTPQCT
jgi:DNA-binding transcriptional MerR regulator